ncbi:MAG TPA: ABC transporter ATP-binding protein [Ottowia sp.]|uniref:ABC transporter ATP-binding protein n=1 Tax=Ottowia sp. TaxID=1898956 RepID=UPI002CB86F92|nr:ABC transporter ATP-binding protein [Ottowia sp.]HMN20949.1 ABC transporter ATP-binding protein [Ottowia sp.]
MLTLTDLTLSYGSFRALEGISLHADSGELVVLLGANGAGKSSTFRAISGLHKAGGSARFGGAELLGLKSAQVVRHGVVQCPEGRKLFPMMSVEKNLLLGAYVYASDKAGNQQALQQIYQTFPILAEKRNDPAGSLSGGQQQMVAIGRALMGRPKLLMLDEPSLGLAPLVVKQMFGIIQDINRRGTTVLLAEQNAYAALKISNRAYVMERGRIVMEGDSKTLLGDERIRKAYIGG